MNHSKGLYIHIPFCKQKCNYCDFNSGPYRQRDLEEYVMLLEKEAELLERKYGKLSIETVFIGGGTPSVLEPEQIKAIGISLKRHFDLSQCYEFSFEANPESVTMAKLNAFKAIGANRVSLGLQTANDHELFAISRIHDWQTFLDAFRQVRAAGYDNVNIDLMIGLPGQTKKSYMDSLQKVISLKPEHLSTYGLILEDETPLAAQVASGSVTVLDGENERELYHESKAFLETEGYDLYEISNFSKQGKHCFHNVNYWRCGEYAALGVGAHGYLMGERYENAETVADYRRLLEQELCPVIGSEVITAAEQETEYVMLGLRMTEGIHLAHFEKLFGERIEVKCAEVISKYKELGLLQINEEWVRLSEMGMDLSNTIIVDFLEALE